MGRTRGAARPWVSGSGRDAARRRCADRRQAMTFCTLRLSATQRGRPRRTNDPHLGCRGLQHRVIHPASTPQGADASLPSGLGPTHGKIHIIYFPCTYIHWVTLPGAGAFHGSSRRPRYTVHTSSRRPDRTRLLEIHQKILPPLT